jgi:hypothetical protein
MHRDIQGDKVVETRRPWEMIGDQGRHRKIQTGRVGDTDTDTEKHIKTKNTGR